MGKSFTNCGVSVRKSFTNCGVSVGKSFTNCGVSVGKSFINCGVSVGRVLLIVVFQWGKVLLIMAPEGRPEMSDVSPLSGISGLSFDSTLLSPLFFCLVLLPFLSYCFLPAGPFF